MHLLLCIGLYTLSFIKLTAAVPELASLEDIAMLKKATFLNEDEIALSVNFVDETKDPYPKNFKGYNVDIDYSRNCYVVFMDKDMQTYRLVESAKEPDGEFGVYLTHTGPCGVCSSLQDLAAYLETPDLTTPVTRCAKMLIPENKKNCLRNIGFTERCMYIWYWNTIYTRRGCFNICIRYQRRARNEPVGSYNPCEPASNVLPDLEDGEDPDYSSPDLVPDEQEPSPASKSYLGLSIKGLTSSSKKNKQSNRVKKSQRSRRQRMSEIGKKAVLSLVKKRKVGCRNSINHDPACKEFQWKNNPLRLNPCLQCDECKSGPMFQKVSGRQRRNSGIVSGIGRPLDIVLDHHYFTEYSPPQRKEL